MILDLAVIIVAVLVAIFLLFPVPIRIFFCGRRRGSFLEIRIFRKKLFRFSKEHSEENSDGAAVMETSPKEPSPLPEQHQISAKNTSEEPVQENKDCLIPSEQPKSHSSKKNSPPPKEKSAPVSDLEFFTLMLEAQFDKKVLGKSFRLGKSFFRLFHCRFESTVVEGIRLENFEQMGYMSGAFGFLKGTFPILKNWELAMDWMGNTPFRIEGVCVVSFSLARLLGFFMVSALSVVGIVRLYFKNRRLYRKNPENIRLSFWRRQVVRFMTSN